MPLGNLNFVDRLQGRGKSYTATGAGQGDTLARARSARRKIGFYIFIIGFIRVFIYN